jgi:replicative DNA helicase
MATEYRLSTIADQSTERLCNVEAEAALLGALMIDNRFFDRVVDILDADDFYDPVHYRIYSAIRDQVAMGRNASPVTLRSLFEHDEQINQPGYGGAGYLALLTGSGAAIIGTIDFARQIAEYGKQRRMRDGLLECLRDMNDTAYEPNAAEHAARIEAIAYEASAGKSTRSTVFSLSDAIDRTVAEVVEAQRTGEPIGAIAAEIMDLTEAVGPIVRGHVQTWAGRPGMGKSALMCSAARAMASGDLSLPKEERRQYGVGVVSLEMGEIDLGQRFAADVAMAYGEKILHSAIRDAKLTAREIKVLSWCADQLRDIPIRLDDAAGITMSQLAMKARRMKRELQARGSDLDVLFIDYLQLLHPDRKHDNRVGDLTEITQGTKRLAKELNCGIVQLSQLSRAVEQREDKVPKLADLRESGTIEQDSDVVMFLYREAYYLEQSEPDSVAKPREWEEWSMAIRAVRDRMDLVVGKRRAGATGRKHVTFLREHQAVRASSFFASENVF